jgi:sulfate permease, SulP family
VTLASLLFMARMSENSRMLPEEQAIDDPAQRAALPPGVEVFRFAGPMFFAAANEMLATLKRTGRKPRAIILRLEQVPYVDATGVTALQGFTHSAQRNGTLVILCELREQPQALLERQWSGFGNAQRAPTLTAALALVPQHD